MPPIETPSLLNSRNPSHRSRRQFLRESAALTGAMKDHVLASGEVVGLGAVDPNAPPPARRGGAPAGAPAPGAGR